MRGTRRLGLAVLLHAVRHFLIWQLLTQGPPLRSDRVRRLVRWGQSAEQFLFDQKGEMYGRRVFWCEVAGLEVEWWDGWLLTALGKEPWERFLYRIAPYC